MRKTGKRWKISEACGKERLPRHKQGTGSTGKESALIFLTPQQERFLLVKGRQLLF
jgi:hypothetical protein